LEVVEPLASGFTLKNRYRIESVLGRGGFSVVYAGFDNSRQDRVVIKELAPYNASRGSSGWLELGPEGRQLKGRFLQEGAVQARCNASGLIPVRDWFAENGTAYMVSPQIEGVVTLDRLLEMRPLTPDECLHIFEQLMDTLEEVHQRSILHRDIKPANILVTSDLEAFLIDFGSAREWTHDRDLTQTVLVTPGYSPPEQLSTRGRRGPSTDIYSLCATLYCMIGGQAPPAVADRFAGESLRAIGKIRQIAGEDVATAIEMGLSLEPMQRPQSIEELRCLIREGVVREPDATIEELDDRLTRSRRFTFAKRECPACSGVLEHVSPLPPGTCPVCQEGKLRKRDEKLTACPSCRRGVLQRREHGGLPVVCPGCEAGVLRYKRALLPGRQTARCPKCGGHGESSGKGLTWSSEVKPKPAAGPIHICDECEAQYHEQPDGRWRQAFPAPSKYDVLFPDEWAAVAAGHDPGSGNADCDGCHASYFVDDASMTLLAFGFDPNGFAAEFEGRRLLREDVRWLARGKSSGNPGHVCEDCHTEFDLLGNSIQLIYSRDRRLRPHVGEQHSREDWHRIASGLPLRGEESQLTEQLPAALRAGYLDRALGFNGRPDLAWKGQATDVATGKGAILMVDGTSLIFGGLWRRWRSELDDIESISADGDLLRVSAGDDRTLALELAPMNLTANLKIGRLTIELTAEDLAGRIERILKPRRRLVRR
jgi:serine/threonine protein kinase